ncbi:MAG: hypothetical protein JSU76_02980 [Dehalococcoidia bacterium]|nr:MAG: hypothetical protein JSU76_02980 [Dehalococcoidia bacterium]
MNKVEDWWVYPGFEIEVVATGLDLPVNLAFVPKPSENLSGVKSYDDFTIYMGSGLASPCGLAFGPDGLYFTDLHGELDGRADIPSGSIYRVKPITEAERLKEAIYKDTHAV